MREALDVGGDGSALFEGKGGSRGKNQRWKTLEDGRGKKVTVRKRDGLRSEKEENEKNIEVDSL